MAASMTMVVLCPNGRKQSVKVSPNTSILEVLEETCKRQGINPGDYDIKHYNKALDLSLSIRFANLPNNALLELNPAKHVRKEGTVTVGLQLESGERLMGDFAPSASISDVVHQCLISRSQPLEQSDAVGEPICIYMRQKLTGDAIKKTTLRSLGLTCGKAIIRLLYRQPEELQQQAHVSAPLTKPFTVPIDTFQISDINVADSVASDYHVRKQPRLDLKSEQKDNPSNSEQSHSLAWPQAQNSDTNQHLIQQESESLQDLSFHSTAVSSSFVQSENISFPKDSTLYRNAELDSCNNDVEKEMRPQNEFESMEFDDASECFEQQTKEIGEIKYLGARNAVLFNLEDITEVKKADFADDFFELTINDLRYLLDEYKKTRCEMENQPLMLNSQRQAKFLHQLSYYKQSVIRIYFPDRLVLQGTFIAEETVQSVIDFVRNFLECKELNFYLYVAPPKLKLLPEKTLLEARLLPAAVVYFGCDVQCSSYLQPAIRNQVSDPRAAGHAAAQSRQKTISNESPILPAYDSGESMPNSSMDTEVLSLPSSSAMRNTPIMPTSTDKLPKWFKLSKK